ncbi:MAG: DUF4402 domain-containing protein [Holophagaceae bacterium]|nr:DUF4402 domain-containing protein [Holophagaceae bacterium]
MKFNPTLLVVILAATTAFAGTDTGTNTVTNSQASAKLKIRKAITLTNNTDLDFGGVVVSGVAASSMTLTPANVLSIAGADILATFNPTTAGAFTVGGTANATYAINAIPGINITSTALPSTPVGVTFTTSKATGTLDGTGSDTFTVGGTASIPAPVTGGDYSGTFSVTVLYN